MTLHLQLYNQPIFWSRQTSYGSQCSTK